MIKEPVWMEDIREQMRKTRFYGDVDEEREQYKKEYLKVLETLDPDKASVMEQYVEQLQKCEFHHIRIAYLEGMEAEKVHQRAKRDRFYQYVMDRNDLNFVVRARISDLCHHSPEFQKKLDSFLELKTKCSLLECSLPEEDRALLHTYFEACEEFYDILYSFAAGFPKGYILEHF